MRRHPTIQDRDIETGHRLTHKYRVTTAEIEANQYQLNEATMRKRLDRLCEGRLLCRLSAWCVKSEPITAPLFSWTPGQATPNFAALARETTQRWGNSPLRKTTIYTASNKLLNYFGLPARPHLKLHQVSHDLGVTQMYFYAKATWPQLEFVGEDLFSPLRGHGEGVEDAQLVDGNRIVCVLEHAGAYRRSRIEHLHQHVAIDRQLSYHLF